MRLCTPPPCSPPPQIVLRKGYHLLAVALFLPAFAADLPLLCAALAVAFAALAAAEVARCCSVPRLGRIVEAFMQVGGRGEAGHQPRAVTPPPVGGSKCVKHATLRAACCCL